MTARDQARQWLAEVLRAGDHELSDIGECGRESARLAIADAIIAASDYVGRGQGGRIALGLPVAIPLDAANDRPSASADGRTGAGETDRTHETAEGESAGRNAGPDDEVVLTDLKDMIPICYGGEMVMTPIPVRCPSCGHQPETHTDDGCWYTIATGRPNANLVCPCAVPRPTTAGHNG